ncbi:uncharacterized protein TM35_000891000 [Trypanosoma theileri]|uniref:Uncharacterized protein n=1 Tax=Trypanosoma theileri TaxID=67003 RepID=A0A1X0NET9_9TRYP|nr:uncharacterized protein TM35_000891000 [Trypanosoma theileri]ORC82516.1 hypothetical protein TM35_000891000 [Trypanosoma theileri]
MVLFTFLNFGGRFLKGRDVGGLLILVYSKSHLEIHIKTKSQLIKGCLQNCRQFKNHNQNLPLPQKNNKYKRKSPSPNLNLGKCLFQNYPKILHKKLKTQQK